MKFGGTSVAGTEKLKNIANIVKSELKNILLANENQAA